MNIHVRVAGRRNQRYALLCRDFLRSRPAAAQAYGLFKHRLAAVGIESGVYADIKDPVRPDHRSRRGVGQRSVLDARRATIKSAENSALRFAVALRCSRRRISSA